MRTVEEMKDSILETTESLTAFQPVFQLYCVALRIRGRSYMEIRRAMIRETAAQLLLFGPWNRGKP